MHDQAPQDFGDLPPTERRNPRTRDIDLLDSLGVLTLINDDDQHVPGAVRAVLPALAEVVDHAVEAIARGGSVHYFGAGTSGRFGVLDSAEVPPTYGASKELFVAHMAGGAAAMVGAVEDAEDSVEAGEAAAAGLNTHDVAIGLAASGGTPYVAAALRKARSLGAFTVAITANPHSSLAEFCDVHIAPSTGPEVITGSSRMKAGTAQKLVLHSLSTAIMVRSERTFSNLMVDVVPTNTKLRRRVVRMLQQGTGTSAEDAERALQEAGGAPKVAMLVLLTGCDVAAARALLAENGQSLRRSLGQSPAVTSTASADASRVALGIDIGASGFRVAVSDETGVRILASHPVVPMITPEGIDVSRIARELRTILTEEGLAGRVECCAVGLAGSLAMRAHLDGALTALRDAAGTAAVDIYPDIVPAYVGALGFAAGAALAAGTGAVALGVDDAGNPTVVDGRGYLLGDLGSGASIGLRGLRAGLGRPGGEPESAALAAAISARFGSAAAAVSALSAAESRGQFLGAFAQEVFAAATSGDSVALAIVEEAADELAATLRAAARSGSASMSAVGGLVSPGSVLGEALSRRVDLTPAAHSPAGGAAILAEARAQGTLPRTFDELAVVRASSLSAAKR